MMAEKAINEPFAVINADDFYGPDSYRIMAEFLSGKQPEGPDEYCLVDYQLDNTLSESGSVSRGICKVSNEGFLTDITEHKKITFDGKQISGEAEGTGRVVFTGKESVSMNLMGFKPTIFEYLQDQFVRFFHASSDRINTEFYLPYAVNEVIRSGKARVKVMHTKEKWFGVTYREDREMVMSNLQRLVSQGVYPSDLWI
jgi:hypothetical protein